MNAKTEESMGDWIRREMAMKDRLDNIGWWRDMLNLAGYVWGGGTLFCVAGDLILGDIIPNGGMALGSNWANVPPMSIMAFACLFISARITIYILKKEKEMLKEEIERKKKLDEIRYSNQQHLHNFRR